MKNLFLISILFMTTDAFAVNICEIFSEYPARMGSADPFVTKLYTICSDPSDNVQEVTLSNPVTGSSRTREDDLNLARIKLRKSLLDRGFTLNGTQFIKP